MYIYIQTEHGCQVIGEVDATTADEIAQAIEDHRPLVPGLIERDEPYCIACGTTVPDVALAPLSRYGRYRFGRLQTMGGFLHSKN